MTEIIATNMPDFPKPVLAPPANSEQGVRGTIQLSITASSAERLGRGVEVREAGARALTLSNREISVKARNRYLLSSPKDGRSQDCGEAQIDSL